MWHDVGMFKVTRFKQVLLGLGLLAIKEEAAVLDIDNSAMTDQERNGAMVNVANGKSSDTQLKEFLKEHHLSISPKAFSSKDTASIEMASTPSVVVKSGAKSVS